MSNYKHLLSDLLGTGGVYALSKSLTKVSAEDQGKLLDFVAAPRAVLAWLVAQVSPLQVGGTKEVKCPGREDIIIKYERTADDRFTAVYSQKDGKVVKEFSNQILPIETLNKSKDEDSEHGFDSVKAILASNSSLIAPQPSQTDHCLWSVIGKLVDALIAKQNIREDFKDAMDKREIKGDKQKVEANENPQEIQEDLEAIKAKDKAVIQESKVQDVSFKVNKEELGKTPIAVNEPLKKLPEKVSKESLKERNIDQIAGGKVKWPDHIPSKHDAAPPSSKMSDQKCDQCKSPVPEGHHSNWCKACTERAIGKSEDLQKKVIAGPKSWGLKQKPGTVLADDKPKAAPAPDPKATPSRRGADSSDSHDAAHAAYYAADHAPHPTMEAAFQRNKALQSPVSDKPKPKLKRPAAKKPVAPKSLEGRGGNRPVSEKVSAPQQPNQDKYVGTHRAHLSHGIGKVIGVEDRDFGKGSAKHYIMEIQDNGVPKKVFVPSESMETRTRAIISPEQGEQLRSFLKAPSGPDPIDHQTWNRRYRDYMDKVHTGQPQQVAEVWKTLRDLGKQKALSFGERKLMEQAHQLLDKELTHSTGRGLEEEDLDNVGKAEMPSGAAMPKGPKPPQPPKPPVPASNQPAAAAAKQSQASAKGKQQKPPKPSMKIPGQPKIPTQNMAQAKGPAMKDEMSDAHCDPQSSKQGHKFFQDKLKKIKATVKSERTFKVSEEEIYSPCHHCGISEFVKSTDGKPKFKPCMCFRSEVVAEDNKTPKKFVELTKSEDGQFHLTFDRSADKDSIRAFLLLLKTALLARKI